MTAILKSKDELYIKDRLRCCKLSNTTQGTNHFSYKLFSSLQFVSIRMSGRLAMVAHIFSIVVSLFVLSLCQRNLSTYYMIYKIYYCQYYISHIWFSKLSLVRHILKIIYVHFDVTAIWFSCLACDLKCRDIFQILL